METRHDWRDVRTMAGATIHAAIMKMQVCAARAQTRPESVLPTVKKAITKRKERNSVVYATPAVSRALTHQKTALVVIPRSIVRVRLMETLFIVWRIQLQFNLVTCGGAHVDRLIEIQ